MFLSDLIGFRAQDTASSSSRASHAVAYVLPDEIQEAQKHNDWPKFADLLSEDLVAIDEDGFRTKKELSDAIQAAGIRFSDHKMEDVRTIREGNGAVVAYKQTLVGTERGKPALHVAHLHAFPLATTRRQMAADLVSGLDGEGVTYTQLRACQSKSEMN